MTYSVLCFNYKGNYRIDNQQIFVEVNLNKGNRVSGEIEDFVGKIRREKIAFVFSTINNT